MKLRLLLFSALVSAGGLWLLAGAQARETKAKHLAPGLARATFGGGCFWCMEPPFEKVPGVHSVVSGYAGGSVKNPSYELVSTGMTGHAEVVQIAYDPARVSFEQLLEVFWRNVDPTDAGGQFCDRGSQYRTAIFYEGESQRLAALESKRSLEASGVLAPTDRHRGRAAPGVLSSRGLPPGLLPEKPGPLQQLSCRLRPRPAARGAVGQGAGPQRAGAGQGCPERMVRRERRKLQEALRGRAQEEARSAAVRGDAGERHRAAVPQRVLEQPRGRHLRRRRLGRAAVQLARQVRLRHRLAELHEAARARRTSGRDATPRTA